MNRIDAELLKSNPDHGNLSKQERISVCQKIIYTTGAYDFKKKKSRSKIAATLLAEMVCSLDSLF